MAMTKLRNARIEKGLTQEKLGMSVFVQADTYGNYERGKQDIPEDVAKRICDKLQIDMKEYFEPKITVYTAKKA